jgi:hypothetical protein
MKILHFRHRGESFKVSLEKETLGHVIQRNEHKFDLPHPSWVILGVSHHHWNNHITLHLSPTMNPKDLLGGLVWDRDHGTVRQWGGMYAGKLPRVTDAFVTEKVESNE